MGGGGAAAKPKKSVEIIVVGRGEGYSDSWIPILDAWVLNFFSKNKNSKIQGLTVHGNS